MTFPVRFDRAVPPTGGPTPGAIALMEWALDTFATATNLGIYNPRRVGGSSAWSLHASGRAIDVGFPYTVGGTPEGHACAAWLVANSAALGVQQVIYAGRIWTNTRAAQGWRAYTGQSPHWEHVHVELQVDASQQLTRSMIDELSQGDDEMASPLQELDAAMRITRQIYEDYGVKRPEDRKFPKRPEDLAYQVTRLLTADDPAAVAITLAGELYTE